MKQFYTYISRVQHSLHDHRRLHTFRQEKLASFHLLEGLNTINNSNKIIIIILGDLCEAGRQVLDW